MKEVPFFENTPNDMRCALAVYRMMYKYFKDQDLTWGELDKMSGFKGNIAAWTVKIWVQMAADGFDIQMVEAFDYRKFASDGDKYLRSYFDKEAYYWQIKKSNILEIQPLIPEFLKTVDQKQESPTLETLDGMLREGRLVFVTLNSRVLNSRPGYSSHSILIYAKEGDNYLVNDPGLPGQAERRIPYDSLYEAMGGDDNTNEMTGVKLRSR